MRDAFRLFHFPLPPLRKGKPKTDVSLCLSHGLHYLCRLKTTDNKKITLKYKTDYGIKSRYRGPSQRGKIHTLQLPVQREGTGSQLPVLYHRRPTMGVSVPDERLTRLAEIVHPGRIVPAVCDIVDIAGLVKGASKGEGLGNKFLGNIREATPSSTCSAASTTATSSTWTAQSTPCATRKSSTPSFSSRTSRRSKTASSAWRRWPR